MISHVQTETAYRVLGSVMAKMTVVVVTYQMKKTVLVRKRFLGCPNMFKLKTFILCTTFLHHFGNKLYRCAKNNQTLSNSCSRYWELSAPAFLVIW